MSRYEYTPPGWPPHCSFAVGWDDGLETYFGLVMDTSIGRDEAGVIASFGGTPPHFRYLDNLMRVVNGRLRARLPPIQLTSELRRALRKDANRKIPVVNAITLSNPGEPAPAPPRPIRPCMALGTHLDYLEGDELQEVMDCMADKYFRLKRLYRARKAAGLSEANDENTKLIRQSLESMEMVCHILDGLVHTDALVAIEALKPFYEFSAAAARLLQAESANAASPSEIVH